MHFVPARGLSLRLAPAAVLYVLKAIFKHVFLRHASAEFATALQGCMSKSY